MTLGYLQWENNRLRLMKEERQKVDPHMGGHAKMFIATANAREELTSRLRMCPGTMMEVAGRIPRKDLGCEKAWVCSARLDRTAEMAMAVGEAAPHTRFTFFDTRN